MSLSGQERKVFEVGCTIDVEHTFDSLHAHVDLDGDIEIRPGDTVKVHGDPVTVHYGERFTLRRTATVARANGLQRLLARLSGNLEFLEMFEVSFSSGRKL